MQFVNVIKPSFNSKNYKELTFIVLADCIVFFYVNKS